MYADREIYIAYYLKFSPFFLLDLHYFDNYVLNGANLFRDNYADHAPIIYYVIKNKKIIFMVLHIVKK